MSNTSNDRLRFRQPFRIALAIALLVAGAALADRVVDASEPVIISNDISNQATVVISTTGGGG